MEKRAKEYQELSLDELEKVSGGQQQQCVKCGTFAMLDSRGLCRKCAEIADAMANK